MPRFRMGKPPRNAAFHAGFVLTVLFAAPLHAVSPPALSPLESVGKSIYFDADLSLRRNQACATCHAPGAGFTGPDSRINAGGSAYEGSVAGLFANRKPPSAAYAQFAPVLHVKVDDGKKVWVGGNFWDGRATGKRLGSPLAEQAQGPFLNPVEHALPHAACVVQRVCSARYGGDFKAQSPGACEIAFPKELEASCEAGRRVKLAPAVRKQVDAAYDRIAFAIAAYESSAEANPFSAKYDAVQAGHASYTAEEKEGLALFTGKGKCANCHTLDKGPKGEPTVFSDYTFDNLGVPRNPDNPWYRQAKTNPAGRQWVDEGLGGFLRTYPEGRGDARANLGKHKVPTLRNVDLRPDAAFVKAYMHNGYFKSLKSVVHFYNTRDVKPRCPSSFTAEAEALARGCWPAPEVTVNLNRDEMGDLKLTAAEEDAIVAFMRALNDGYTAAR